MSLAISSTDVVAVQHAGSGVMTSRACFDIAFSPVAAQELRRPEIHRATAAPSRNGRALMLRRVLEHT
jgi:hypothetical protein